MLAIRTVSALGVLAMTIALALGFSSGDFSSEGAEILQLAWGRVTLIDLYVGVAIFSAFVAWRERRAAVTVAWVASFVILGNLATAVYLLVASLRAPSIEELLTPRR